MNKIWDSIKPDYSKYEILIVDDSTYNIKVLVANLIKKGFKFSIATNGKQGVATAEKRRPDLILLDINMPEMNGFEVCEYLKSKEETKDIPIVFITSRNDTEDIVKGFELGGVDYITKPFNQAELFARITTRLALLEYNRRLTSAYEKMKSDLEAAAKIQQAFLPASNLELNGYLCTHAFMPSVYISGDTLNYFKLDEGHIAFFVIDVTGHGIASALLSVSLSRVLSSEKRLDNPLFVFDPITGEYLPNKPEKVVADLNKRFQSKGDSGEYFTILYGVLNINEGQIEICQAGHPMPFIVNREGEITDVGQYGFPVGILPKVTYDSYSVNLKPGDTFIVYSDGVSECINPEGIEYSLDRIKNAFINRAAGKINNSIDEVMHELKFWRAVDDFDDDVSILAIERI